MFPSLQVAKMRVDMLLQPRKKLPRQLQVCLEGKWPQTVHPIASNKNGCKSDKNIEGAMIGTTNAQLPQKIVDAMLSAKMKLILSLEMGS